MDSETERLAAEAVDLAAAMGKVLDYTEASIPVVEEALQEVSVYLAEIPEAAQRLTAERFGCYLLVVGYRTFGGRTLWHEEREQPVLVVGEPDCRIAMVTWDKVLGRLRGDKADDIAFFWDGFAERARQREPGLDVLFV
jgi:hypothetical protein